VGSVDPPGPPHTQPRPKGTMISLILTTLTSLVAGVLIGGCTRQDDTISHSLIQRNAQLENQTSAQHDALTALAAFAAAAGSPAAPALVAGNRLWPETE